MLGGQDKPFKQLGNRLKLARETIQETLAEVSGAVEIGIDSLQQIELGGQRPSEDTLLLLINHFNLGDDEATDIWEMAGYINKDGGMAGEAPDGFRQLAAIIPLDNRVVYTDLVHVTANNYGVVMNFMQNTGSNGQPMAVARVGMSKEHARSVLEVLQQTLKQAEFASKPKALPLPAKAKKSKTDK
jgi:transcriptional regulator with XRE-family HTH domain